MAGSTYQATRYSYDAAGQLTGTRDPANNAWTYTYDFAGRQVRATDPDAGTTRRTYDAAGQVTSVTNGAGARLSYAYDDVGRVSTVSDDAGVRARWTYDTAKDQAGNPVLGQAASATRYVDGAAYTTAVETYDEAYRALSSTVTLPAVGDLAGLSARSFTTRYAYTPDGQVESLTLPKVTTNGSSGGTTVLGQEQVTTYFDAASMPRWMAGGFGWGTYVAESRFTAYGQQLLTDLGNTYGAVVSYQYDEVTQRLTHVALKREQVTGTDLAVTYAYDAAGNVTSLQDQPTNPALGGAAGVDLQCFTYDGLRRLTSAWTAKDAANCDLPAGQVRPAMVGGAAPYWTQFEYDPLGNRTVKVDHATDGSTGTTTTRYTHGAGAAGPHALTSMTTSVDGATPVPAGSFTYDGAGNQVSRSLPGQPTQALVWDPEGELTEVTAAGEGGVGDGAARFVYDANGDRLTRTDPSGTTVYLPGGQEVHVDTSGEVSARRYYAFAGQTVAVRTDRGLGGVTSLVNDAHGTPLAAVPNTTWSVSSAKRLYTDPFGAVRGGSVPGDRLFLGKTRDTATGLTLLGARYYDEMVGRFISVDPVMDLTDPQQWHGYAYANNNPVTWTDPTGLKPHVAHDGAPGGRMSQPSVLERLTTAVRASASLWTHYIGGMAAGARSLGENVVAAMPVVQAYSIAKDPQAFWETNVTAPLDKWRDVRNFDDARMAVGNELYAANLQPFVTWWNDADNLNDRFSKFGSIAFHVAALAAPVRGAPRGKAPTQALSRPAAGSTDAYIARVVSRADLNPAQLANLARYTKKLPAGAEHVIMTRGPAGSVHLSARVPGRVPGSYATYNKVIDASGKTTGYTKVTIAPNGTIVHVKDKLN